MAVVNLRNGESQDSLLKRFRKKVVKSGVLSTVRRKRWFVSKSEFANYIIEGNYIRVADIAPRIIRLLEETHRELEDFGTPANLYSTLHGQYGLSLMALGKVEKAEDLCQRGVSFSREVGHLFSIGLAEMFFGISVLGWEGEGTL